MEESDLNANNCFNVNVYIRYEWWLFETAQHFVAYFLYF